MRSEQYYRTNKLSGRPFLIITHKRRPANARRWDYEATEVVNGIEKVRPTRVGNMPFTPTHKKGWQHVPGYYQTIEQAGVVDRVTPEHLRTSLVIIDIMGSELVSHSYPQGPDIEPVDKDAAVEYYLNKYMDVCKQGLDIYITKMARESLTERNLDIARRQLSAATGTDVNETII